MHVSVHVLVTLAALAVSSTCLPAQTWKVTLKDTMQILEPSTQTNVSGGSGGAQQYLSTSVGYVEIRAEVILSRDKKGTITPRSVFGLRVLNPDHTKPPLTDNQLTFRGIQIDPTIPLPCDAGGCPTPNDPGPHPCLYPTGGTFPGCMTDFLSGSFGGAAQHPIQAYRAAGIGTCFDNLNFNNMKIGETATASDSPCTNVYVYAKDDCSVPYDAGLQADAVKKPVNSLSKVPKIRRIDSTHWLVEIDQEIDIRQVGYYPADGKGGRTLCGFYMSGAAYTTPVRISMVFEKVNP